MITIDKNNLYDEPTTKPQKVEKESEPKVVSIDNDQILYRDSLIPFQRFCLN